MRKHPASFPRRDRGSLLIVAMILAAVIGISLVSYVQLGRSSLSISNRALYHNGAMNIAENGLEEAMYSINKKIADSSYSWTANGWTSANSGADMRRTLGPYTFDQNSTGTTRVYVVGYSGTAPKAIARSTITLGGAASRPIEKWVEVQLRKTSKFSNGLVAKQSITFSGNNASVDSWNSDPDNNTATAAIPYSAGVRNDKGTVGSISVAVDAILVQNADIWGYAATGGAMPSVGPNGLVGPFGTASGTMNPANVSTDFTASFDAVTAPTTTAYSLGGITGGTSLPRTGDVAAADGKYYYTGTQINFNNATFAVAKLNVGDPSPKVVLTLTSTTTSINIGGGSGALNVQTGATLEIYAPGDIKVAGQGIMNGGTTAGTSNQPINLQIWGTKTSGTQSIEIAGNGALSAVVYAPQGSLKINGNGDVMGSFVANDIRLVGNAAFHYDESLGNFGGDNPYRVSGWKELTTAAARASVESLLSF
jgi:Tfp pilus assembly protein PilX